MESTFLSFQDLEGRDLAESVTQDIELNRIIFEFPSGLNQLDLLEECRALNNLDDFDFMYDILMQSLVGKSCRVLLRNFDNSVTVLGEFNVTDRYQNMRMVPILSEYPVLITWMANFLGAKLQKKYPTPSLVSSKKEKQEAQRVLKKMLTVKS